MYCPCSRSLSHPHLPPTHTTNREIIFSLLSQRSALFASAYSQLAQWQRDMGAVGLKHNAPSMTHLTAALERLGAVEDCLQLARLAEGARPGEFVAHRAALKVSSWVGCSVVVVRCDVLWSAPVAMTYAFAR